MRYSCEKTVIYKNVKILCGSAKPTLHFFKIPRARIYLTRIRLIAAHVTLTHATLNSKGTARLRKRKASYSDRLVSSSRSYSIEKNIRNKIFAGEVNKED
jgi:hypothetical protein